MERPQVVKNAIDSLIESWNDSNQGEKLNPELVDLIEVHLNMLYISGVDSLAFLLLNTIEKEETSSSQISRYYIRSLIMNHKP